MQAHYRKPYHEAHLPSSHSSPDQEPVEQTNIYAHETPFKAAHRCTIKVSCYSLSDRRTDPPPNKDTDEAAFCLSYRSPNVSAYPLAHEEPDFVAHKEPHCCSHKVTHYSCGI
jgi:hypothetical protein